MPVVFLSSFLVRDSVSPLGSWWFCCLASFIFLLILFWWEGDYFKLHSISLFLFILFYYIFYALLSLKCNIFLLNSWDRAQMCFELKYVSLCQSHSLMTSTCTCCCVEILFGIEFGCILLVLFLSTLYQFCWYHPIESTSRNWLPG